MKRKEAARNTAVIYTRYSPRPAKRREDGSVVACESCELQEEHCREWCDGHGYKVLAVCNDEGLSGAEMDGRPELRRALDIAKANKSTFVSYALSRWARSTKDAILIADELEKAGCQLCSITGNIDTSNPHNRFAYTVFSAFAELERGIISERTSDAMLRHARNGRKIGRDVTYGWRVNPATPGYYAKDDAEQAVIERIKALHGSGLGLRAIGRKLEAEGILCRGHSWNHKTVAKVLARAG